jgi:hypothetical protein
MPCHEENCKKFINEEIELISFLFTEKFQLKILQGLKTFLEINSLKVNWQKKLH